MKYALLATAASIAFLAAGAAAQAQDNSMQNEKPKAERSEARPMTAPKAEEGAPRAAQTERKEENAAPKSAQSEPRKEEAAPKSAQSEPRKDEAAPKSAQSEPRKDEAAPTREAPKSAQSEPRKEDTTKRAEEKTSTERAETNKTTEQRAAERKDDKRMQSTERAGDKREGGGQARVVGNVHTTTEHATRVSEMLVREHRSENVNITIDVGVRVPESVAIYPVPEDIIAFAPEYRGYDYFISSGEVVFVSPDSHEIVATIGGGAGYEGRAAAEEAPAMRAARPCPVEN